MNRWQSKSILSNDHFIFVAKDQKLIFPMENGMLTSLQSVNCPTITKIDSNFDGRFSDGYIRIVLNSITSLGSNCGLYGNQKYWHQMEFTIFIPPNI